MKYLPVLFSLLLFSSGPVYAYPFIAAPVISGLSNCGVIKNDNGSWQVTFSVDWLDMPANPPGSSLNRRVSRGIVIYLYDKKGKSIDGYLPRSSITMNGVIPGDSHGIIKFEKGHLAYGNDVTTGGWKDFGPHTGKVVVNVARLDVAIMAIRLSNVYSSAVSYDQAVTVYFTALQTTSTCQQMTNPDTLPVIVNLTMNAPDWNLGEIATGQQQKVMTNNADRLCISYLSTESAGKDFIVNATNANGIENNRFILKHSLEPANTLPYTLTLDSMGKRILLPNTDNSSIRFEDSGNQTCFTPTFDLYGSDNQEIGDYTDVITYEIVTKS